MKKILLALASLSVLAVSAMPSVTRTARTAKSAYAGVAKSNLKRDAATVKNYILKQVGKEAIAEIRAREGGEKFLAKFFGDQKWMEMFAGSGIFMSEKGNGAAEALKLLDTLCWNDKPVDAKGTLWEDTPLGRCCLTAIALNNDHNWGGNGYCTEEKLVEIADYYRQWDMNGTLHSSVKELDCRQWREVQGLGQNWELPPDNLKWIHDFATVPANGYYGVEWQCHYRLWNCFGASVHGPMYYAPWSHRWNTQELRYRIGGVCGGLSKFGSQCASSHGVRSFTAGQPGHCAFMLWDFNQNYWGLAYSVTGHSGLHFRMQTDSYRFPAAEEQDRYYQNPNRMDAEFLRWKGEYKKSMLLAHNNWQAADEWRASLKGKGQVEWEDYGNTVLATFDEAPCLGWCLYRSYIDSLGGNLANKIEAAKKGLMAMKEYKGATAESIYLDEVVLNDLVKLFGDNKQAKKTIFETALQSYAHEPTFYRQTINWGSTKFMDSSDDTKWYLVTVGRSALKNKVDLDYKGMIYTAAKSGDITTFKQVYLLMDKLDPKKTPKTAGKAYPEQDYGGTLLSKDGLLQTSDMVGEKPSDSPCGYDNPVTYRNVLNAPDFEGGNGFHTEKGKAPFGQVKLPGKSTIMGVTVVNAGGGYNATRQVPLSVWVSDDGVAWDKVDTANAVQDVWKFKFANPRNAQYVRVGRDPSADKEEVFHLHKILVYGTKLY